MVKVFDIFLVLTTPSGLIGPCMYVLGSLGTGVWNYYLLGSAHCVSRHTKEGKCAGTGWCI